jgi:hypothetical protein
MKHINFKNSQYKHTPIDDGHSEESEEINEAIEENFNISDTSDELQSK